MKKIFMQMQRISEELNNCEVAVMLDQQKGLMIHARKDVYTFSRYYSESEITKIVDTEILIDNFIDKAKSSEIVE